MDGRHEQGRALPSGRDRIAGKIARIACGLPRPLQRALAGPPIEIDGQRLEADMQLLLRLRKTDPEPDLRTLSAPQARDWLRRTALAIDVPKARVAKVETIELPGPAGPIGARLYVPDKERAPLPLLVYLHGGGFVRGDLDTHDNVCRFLAREGGLAVMSVDYRLAPEHPFPAAVDDGLAAFRFAAANAADLGADPATIAIGGDSAGGNLAAVLGWLALQDGGPVPSFLLMLYPATDASAKRRSFGLFREGFLLTETEVDWYYGHYLPDAEAALDPRVSPLLAEDLSGMPPSYVATAGFDPLRDEGEEYAGRLREAGVPVSLRRHRGLVHGFANMTSLSANARAAMHESVGALRVGLAQAATASSAAGSRAR